MKASIVNAASDEDFKALALADYINDVTNNYADLMSTIQETIEADVVLDEQGDVDVEADLIASVDNVLSSHGYSSDLVITLPQGYCTIKEMLDFIRVQTNKYSDVAESDPVAALTDDKLRLKMAGGTIAPASWSASVTDILDAVKQTLHASAVSSATLYASMQDKVADRLTVFNDRIQTYFSNAYTDISNFGAYCKSLLGSVKNSAASIAYGILDVMSIFNRPQQLKQSPLYETTGATPIAALDFTTAKQIIAGTGAIIGRAIAKVFSGIFSAIGRIGIRAKRKVEGALWNPMDIAEINTDDDQAVRSVDFWAYQNTQATHTHYYPDVSNKALIDSWMASHANKWQKYKFIFGELLYRFDSAKTEIITVGQAEWVKATFTNVVVKFKPYYMNHNVVMQAMSDLITSSTTIQGTGDSSDPNSYTAIDIHDPDLSYNMVTTEAIVEAFELMKGSDQLYQDVEPESNEANYDGVEKRLYAGATDAFALFVMTMLLGADELFYNKDEVGDQYVNRLFIADPSDWTNRVPDNLSFSRVSSGWNGNPSSPTFNFAGSPAYKQSITNGLWPVGYDLDYELTTAILRIYITQSVDRANNPTDYVFLPYRNDMDGFDNSQLRIKTDSENQQAATSFLTNLVIVTTLAIVGFTAGVAIRKLQRRSFFRKQQFVGQCDNAMWNSNGKASVLTKAEQRKYIRYARKLNASGLLTSGVQSGVGESASSLLNGLLDSVTTTDTIGLSDIQKAIVG